MGSKKRLSLKQMERMQRRREKEKREKEKRSKKSTSSFEKKSTRIMPPSVKDEKVIKEILHMKVLTPYTVASRFDLRLSVAKDFLEELHERGIISYVSSGRNIKIYKPAG